ncbi:MAG TPA: carboxypeptidase-like regulatory domain-containing protein [Thermoanaerobaculia bacterium]
MRRLSIRFFVPLALATGCVTINGKSYPPDTRFVADVECETQQSGENLHVVVNDWKGRALPGTKIRIVQEPHGAIDTGVSDLQGAAAFSVGADTWKVSVWFPGYTPGTQSVQIETGQACVVSFYLRFSRQIDASFLVD